MVEPGTALNKMMVLVLLRMTTGSGYENKNSKVLVTFAPVTDGINYGPSVFATVTQSSERVTYGPEY